tara:strand:+ start:73 stop:582 length:510 start_codon:yes stop_codon:yes gene_type:complete
MTYFKHKYDKDGSCSTMGETAEESFDKSMLSLGFLTEPTGFKDQVRHIDFFVKGDFSVDVKSMKRLERGGDLQENYVWVEFQSTNGSKGWLYGDCSHIAFELEKKFVLVGREELALLCETIVNDEYVKKPKDAHLFKYQRAGRKDIISLVPMHTILTELPCLIIKKHSF